MDLENFINKLDNTTNDVLEIVKQFSHEQLNLKQGDRWSILEIIEHLYLTDSAIFTIISRPSAKINSSTEIAGNEALQKILVEQRSEKITTPGILSPKGEIKDLAILVNMFISQRELLKTDLSTKKILIDNRVHLHPLLGEMTIIDWLNFIIHHTRRHIEQIKDIGNN